jgi:hypothetical protein
MSVNTKLKSACTLNCQPSHLAAARILLSWLESGIALKRHEVS